MAFMLPVYTGEEIRKMQDGRHSCAVRQAIHIQLDIDRNIPAVEPGSYAVGS